MPLNFDDNVYCILKESMDDLFPELIKVFFKETELSINQIQTAITRDNFDEIHLIAHKLKSSAKTFGAISLVEVLENIESTSSLTKLEIVLIQEKLLTEYELVKEYILSKS